MKLSPRSSSHMTAHQKPSFHQSLLSFFPPVIIVPFPEKWWSRKPISPAAARADPLSATTTVAAASAAATPRTCVNRDRRSPAARRNPMQAMMAREETRYYSPLGQQWTDRALHVGVVRGLQIGPLFGLGGGERTSACTRRHQVPEL